MKKFGKKAVIYKEKDGRRFAGFLDSTTGVFTPDVEIKIEKDIDAFMEKYDLTVVMIKKRTEA